MEIFKKHYGFPIHEMDGEITMSGVYEYPNDPPMPPLIAVKSQTEIMRQYEHAIVSIVNLDTNETFITRMD